MAPGPSVQADYVVVVRDGPQGCVWIVEQGAGRPLSGAAPDIETARRRGAFAAAALHSFDRISRRRF